MNLVHSVWVGLGGEWVVVVVVRVFGGGEVGVGVDGGEYGMGGGECWVSEVFLLVVVVVVVNVVVVIIIFVLTFFFFTLLFLP